jgi:hypothetical protein
MNTREKISVSVITEKISRSVHERLKKAHPKWMGKTGQVIPFYRFLDLVIESGLTAMEEK